MKIEVFADETIVAQQAARFISAEARAAVAVRGRFLMAVSGGRTPWLMLRALVMEDVPWKVTHIFQVDERNAPAGHVDRNFTHMHESLLDHVPLPPSQVHEMPVEVPDFDSGAELYAMTLKQIAGSRPELDFVHLGLGPDGHTASLVPGDPVLDITDADVAVTGVYQGRRRMTLTYPILNRALGILWVVTGNDKAEMLLSLLDGNRSIPAGRVQQERGFVFADKAAAMRLGAR